MKKLTGKTLICANSLISIAALFTSLWAIYLENRAQGFLVAIILFLLFSLLFRLGAAPLFMAASSLLYFHFKVVAPWVPLTSYGVGLLSLTFTFLLLRKQN